jgi:uncharacterized protein YxjI
LQRRRVERGEDRGGLPAPVVGLDSQLRASAPRERVVLRARFSIDVPGPDDLEASGNFLEHDYAFERGGREARASKKWVTLSDTYSIDIDEHEDVLLILACAVVIDLVSHPDKQND